MGDEARKVEALEGEIQRLHWRISTLEVAEFECARAVTALADSEARYRRLLDEAGFPITISTVADSTILFANPLACRLFGLENPLPSGRKMLEYYPDPAKRWDLVARLHAEGRVGDWEVMMLDGVGRPRALIVSASLIVYEGQEAILATSNDITERRHAEALFQTMVETSPDGFGIADLEGRLTYVSPRALLIFGYTDQVGLLGRNLSDFVSPEDQPRLVERLRSLLKQRHQGPSEWTGVRRDGSTFPQETNGEVLRNPDGTPKAFFFIIRDLSNRKRAERAIRWTEKLESLGLMAAGIAHELNNAFQVTQSHLELALDMCSGEPRLREALSKVGQGMDRATALAGEMLDYASRNLRVDAPLDLNHLVEQGITLWREYLASEVPLVFIPGKDSPPVVADEGQTMKVLSALVLNALEATAGRGGSVVITTELKDLTLAELSDGFWPAAGREGRFLHLEVKDAGVGITRESLERICDPFFTTKGQGRGLGLSAALGILRSHGACLQILSQPGEGTAVRAYFPVSVLAASIPPPVEHPRPAASGILVVDDEELIKGLVVQKMRDWGLGPVYEASDGAEALALFHRHHRSIGILLTDATMPRMSGPEAFEAMRKLSPSLQGILMTGYSESFGQGTASAFGFSEFLKKPFRFEELKAKLASVRTGGDAALGR